MSDVNVELRNEIDEIKKNLIIIEQAKRSCTCDTAKPHYHELVWDGDSSNEYRAETKKAHEAFISKLYRQLKRMQKKHSRLV